MYSQKTKSEIRARERELSREKSADRHFNKPLRIFVQRKYKEVYEEYCEFYTRMVAEKPNRKDLCKSNIFKQFLLDNPNNTDEEIIQSKDDISEDVQTMAKDTACKLFIPRIELESVLDNMLLNEQPIIPHPDNITLNEEPNILVQALSEIINGETVPVESQDFDDRVNIVNDILNEMQRQTELRGILDNAGVNLIYSHLTIM